MFSSKSNYTKIMSLTYMFLNMIPYFFDFRTLKHCYLLVTFYSNTWTNC